MKLTLEQTMAYLDEQMKKEILDLVTKETQRVSKDITPDDVRKLWSTRKKVLVPRVLRPGHVAARQGRGAQGAGAREAQGCGAREGRGARRPAAEDREVPAEPGDRAQVEEQGRVEGRRRSVLEGVLLGRQAAVDPGLLRRERR